MGKSSLQNMLDMIRTWWPIVLFIGTVGFGYHSLKLEGKIYNKISESYATKQAFLTTDEKIKEIAPQIVSLQIQYATINQRLQNIEELLKEMRQELVKRRSE